MKIDYLMEKKCYILCLLFFLSSATAVFSQNKDAEDFFLKGKNYAEQNKLDEALVAFEVAIQKDGTVAKYHFNKALVFMKMRTLEDAEVTFLKSVELDPTLVEAYVNLAKIAQQKNDYDAVIKYLDDAYQHDANVENKVSYKKRILQLLMKLDRIDQSGQHIQDALAVAPNDDYILYLDGRYNNYVSLNFQKAEVSLGKAVELMYAREGRVFPTYYYELGYAYYNLENFKQAAETFDLIKDAKLRDMATEMRPEYNYQRSVAYFNLYDFEKAENLLQQTIKMDPTYEAAYDLLIDIKENRIQRKEIIGLMLNKVEISKSDIRKAKILAEIVEIQMNNSDFVNVKQTIQDFESTGVKLPDVQFVKAYLFYREKNYVEAEALLLPLTNYRDMMIKAKSTFLLAMIKKDKGEMDEAIRLFNSDYPASYKMAAREQLKNFGASK